MAFYNYPLQYPQGLGQYNLQSNLQPNLQSVATQPQIQNGGFISVRSEEEARNYPIAYGNSITFKDETAPYVYVKTMGFSQLDRPVFEKFRLVKEAPETKISDDTPEGNKVTDETTRSEIRAIQDALSAFSARLDTLESDVEDLKSKIGEITKRKTEVKRNERQSNNATAKPIQK